MSSGEWRPFCLGLNVLIKHIKLEQNDRHFLDTTLNINLHWNSFQKSSRQHSHIISMKGLVVNQFTEARYQRLWFIEEGNHA